MIIMVTFSDEDLKEIKNIYADDKTISSSISDKLRSIGFKSDQYTTAWLRSFLSDFASRVDIGVRYDEDEIDDKLSELVEQFVDSEVDSYTGNLTEWLASDENRVYYLTEAIENGATDGFSALSDAQAIEIQEIADIGRSFLESFIERMPEDEEVDEEETEEEE
jgi:hypothetical protein